MEALVIRAVPFVPVETSRNVRRCPSASVAVRVPFTDLSSAVVTLPLFATGAWLVEAGVMVTVTVAIFESDVPSLAWKVKVSVSLAPAVAV